MADVSHRGVQSLALVVITEHGEGAALYAVNRAEELRTRGALTASKKWRQILAEIKRLQAMKPEGRVN